MTKTINCTNPSCGTLITVPEGAMQVICPDCNTWHFPSDSDQGGNQNNFGDYGQGAYGPPPEQPAAPPVSNSPYTDPPNDPYGFPEAEPSPSLRREKQPSPQPGNRQPSEPMKTLGYLVTENGERLALREGKNIIGRKNVDLIIDDKTVSRRHCVLEIASSHSGAWEYTIYDIGHLEGTSSTNGVFISGRSLRLQDYERIPIGNGTSIRLGKVQMVLQCN